MEGQTIKMKMARITAVLSLVAIAGLQGCYYDTEEELYPDGSPCDTTNVTYSGVVLPVIQDNCRNCHSGSAPQGNVLLDSYENIAAAGRKPAGQYGSLYGAISHDPGNSPMPKNGNKLSGCTIEQIKKWIDDGAPNN